MKRAIKNSLKRFGYELRKSRPPAECAGDITDEEREIIAKARPYTMTSVERLLSLIHAVKHLVHSGCPGSFVECGVWKGGSMIAVADTLLRLGVRDRDLYLLDTFEGLPAPDEVDRRFDGVSARDTAQRLATQNEKWCCAGLQEVRRNLERTQYPDAHLHFIQGKVEETIPHPRLTGPIALLRLDTDWYSSTRHELEQLFPLLSPGGILIIDDYGYWQGARRAVDEFLALMPRKFYLHRVDSAARLIVNS